MVFFSATNSSQETGQVLTGGDTNRLPSYSTFLCPTVVLALLELEPKDVENVFLF